MGSDVLAFLLWLAGSIVMALIIDAVTSRYTGSATRRAKLRKALLEMTAAEAIEAYNLDKLDPWAVQMWLDGVQAPPQMAAEIRLKLNPGLTKEHAYQLSGLRLLDSSHTE
jgi:hypothetical protein